MWLRAEWTQTPAHGVRYSMPMTVISTEDVILQTDASGAPVRLEYVRGHLKLEASPASRHQKAAKPSRHRHSLCRGAAMAKLASASRIL
jgi:hypothetical protein